MSMQNATSDTDWYNKTLDLNDIIAGGSLILFAFIFLPIYTLIAIVLYRKSHVITGFRYLLSASIADMLLLLNYSLWPGIIILLKKRIPSLSGRRIFQAYLDWIWFSMCYHIPLVAWSRFAAIYRPYQFKVQKLLFSSALCLICYLIAFIQSMVAYFQPWYVTFYYEPSAYGMLPEDLQMYLKGGKMLFFMSFHSVIIIATFILYSSTIFLLLKHNRRARNALFGLNEMAISQKIPPFNSNISATVNSSIRTESRLILPCICDAVMFIIGQVVISIGTGEGRWATWLVLILFSSTAAVEPLLLLIFSRVIRQNALIVLCRLFGRKTKSGTCITAAKTTHIQDTRLAEQLRCVSKRTRPYGMMESIRNILPKK